MEPRSWSTFYIVRQIKRLTATCLCQKRCGKRTKRWKRTGGKNFQPPFLIYQLKFREQNDSKVLKWVVNASKNNRQRSPPFWNVRFQTLSVPEHHLGSLCKVASGKKTFKKLQTGKKDLALETQMKRWKATLDILLHLCGTHFKDRETNKENQVRIIQKSFPSDVEPSLRFSFKISFLMTSVIYVRKAILIALYDQNSLVSFRPQFLNKSWYQLKERWR